MPDPSPKPVAAILSPCVGTCRLDTRSICIGCHRTLGEIAAWSKMPDAERTRLMDSVLPARAAAVGMVVRPARPIPD